MGLLESLPNPLFSNSQVFDPRDFDITKWAKSLSFYNMDDSNLQKYAKFVKEMSLSFGLSQAYVLAQVETMMHVIGGRQNSDKDYRLFSDTLDKAIMQVKKYPPKPVPMIDENDDDVMAFPRNTATYLVYLMNPLVTEVFVLHQNYNKMF